MRPWITDANNISINESWRNIAFITNHETDSFLNDNTNFFIVAEKGIGKTLLLKKKSQEYRKSKKGHVFHPKYDLCEKLSKLSHDVNPSKEELEQFSKYSHWMDLWKICIKIVAVNATGEDIPKDISKFLPNTSTIKGILTTLIRDRSSFNKITRMVEEQIDPILNKSRQDIAIFIDNVDEMLDDHVSSININNQPNLPLSPNVWINAQIGLLKAALSIFSSFNKIKTYCTARIEAINSKNNKGSTGLQEESNRINLSYTNDEIKNIFINNIALMDEDALIAPESKDPIERFFGLKRLRNLKVKNKKLYVNEDVFEYILRHTFQRPREIVHMGYEVSKSLSKLKKHINKASKKKRKTKIQETIRETVNNTSYTLLEQYKTEISSFVDIDKYHATLPSIKRQVITRDEADRIEKYLNKSTKSDNHLQTLHSMGLLGIIKTDTKDTYKQHFLPVAKKVFDDINLPESSYYIIHPSMDDEIKRYSLEYQNDTNNVIGQDRVFKNSYDTQKKPTHIHFGAGKLGLGLVCPLFHESSRLIIIQRPTPHWEIIRDTVQIKINGNTLAACDVVTDKTSIKELIEIIDSKNDILILSENDEILQIAINCADSISTALGSYLYDIADTLSLYSNIKQINLYPFENNSDMVKIFATRLSNRTDKIQVTPVVSDRICYRRDINPDSIDISCEEYNDVHIYISKDKPKTLESVESINLHYTTSPNVQDFFYNRKFWLVNGMHMLLAVYSFYYLIEKNIPFQQWKEIPINIFNEISSIERSLPILSSFQSIRLILSTDVKVLKKSLDTINQREQFEILKKYSENIFVRFDRQPDPLFRVLDLSNLESLKSKYLQRIKRMNQFKNKNEDQIINFIKTNDINSLSIELINSVFNDLLSKLNEVFLALLNEENQKPK